MHGVAAVRRGFSDEIGSWNTICIRVRAARICFAPSAVRSVPSKHTDPRRGRELHDRPTGGGLAAAGLADDAERLAAQDVEADPGDGADGQPGAPDGELDHEVLGAQDDVVAGRRAGGRCRCRHQRRPLAADRRGAVRRSRRSRSLEYSGDPTGYQQAYR